MTNQFGMGPMGMGSLSGMLESVELLKKAWSGFSLPASFAPTMDLDELDKRIADLKTVEQWLTMNLTLLRGTVQGMEIQRGTVAALKAFGSSMGSVYLARGAFAAAAQAAASAAASATGASSTSACAPDPGSTAGDCKGQPTGQASADASPVGRRRRTDPRGSRRGQSGNVVESAPDAVRPGGAGRDGHSLR